MKDTKKWVELKHWSDSEVKLLENVHVVSNEI